MLHATAVCDHEEIEAVLSVFRDGAGTNADAVMAREMLVPMGHSLNDDDVADVCDPIEAFLRE